MRSRLEYAAAIAIGVLVVSSGAAIRTWSHSKAIAIPIEIAVLGAAYVAWRIGRKSKAPAFGLVVLSAIAIVYVIVSRDKLVESIVLGLAQVACGWIIGRSTKRFASLRLLWAEPVFSHLLLVARGSGIARAETWGAVYLCIAAVIITVVREASQAPKAAASNAALSVQDIDVSFGANEVLRGASLQCSSGELIALAGANGSGKSTLLRVAAGLAKAPSVLLNGEDVSLLDSEERTRKGLCFVSGSKPIFPELTVEQNLRVAAGELNARVFRETTDAIMQAVPALAGRLHSRAGALSGGEQRLLAVAQTLYRKPSVLMADELAAGLDREARSSVLEMLTSIARSGCAVIVVDHDLPTLLSRSDKAALLRDGRITMFDDPMELLASHSELLPATFLAGVSE
ncbi:MAG: ATP-binding cassette domain-containing protein [Actinomycetota bacterium]